VDQICPISGQICLAYTGYVWFGGRICPVQQDNTLQKSRSEAKTVNLDPDKLTTSKQDTIEQIEIK
jgi:hypothetical protein